VEDSTKTDTSERLRKAMAQITQLQADLTAEQGSAAQYKAIAQASETALKDLQSNMEQAATTFKSQQEKADVEITTLREKVLSTLTAGHRAVLMVSWLTGYSSLRNAG
jgi:predicted  nucleic acid-binding Zn-ribbon protein